MKSAVLRLPSPTLCKLHATGPSFTWKLNARKVHRRASHWAGAIAAWTYHPVRGGPFPHLPPPITPSVEFPAMTDLLWIAILTGLTLLTLAFLRLASRA